MGILYSRAGHILALACILFIASSLLLSGQPSFLKLGISGSIGNDQHEADFTGFPGVLSPEAPFSGTDGTGWRGGIFADYLFGKLFSAGIRLNYRAVDAEFRADEQTVIGINGVPTPATIRHSLNSTFNVAEVEPTITLSPFDGLILQAGFAIGFPTTSSYQQTQRFSDPDNVRFVEEPEPFSGTIPSLAEPLLSVTGLIGYEIPVNQSGSFRIRPEIGLQRTLGDIVQGTNWRTTSMRAGLSLVLGPVQNRSVRRDTVYVRDTTTALLFDLAEEQTRLLERTMQDEEILAEDARIFRTTVTERYVVEIPRPRPMLTGNIETWFVEPDGSLTRQATLTIRRQPVERRTLFPRTSRVDTLTETNPPELLFKVTTVSEAGIAEWQFVLSVGDHQILRRTGTGEPPENINVSLDEYQDFTPFLRRELTYTLQLTDEEGQTVSGAEGTVRFTAREEEIEREIQRREYWLPVASGMDNSLSPEEIAAVIGVNIPDGHSVLVRYWYASEEEEVRAYATDIASGLGLSAHSALPVKVVQHNDGTLAGGVIVVAERLPEENKPE